MSLTFPNIEVFQIDCRSCYILYHVKEHFLRGALQFLNHCVNCFPVLKVNMVVRVFGFAISMALKLICIDGLHIISWETKLAVGKIQHMTKERC